MKAAHQQQEHTSSYYAATVNEVTDYPKLEGQCFRGCLRRRGWFYRGRDSPDAG